MKKSFEHVYENGFVFEEEFDYNRYHCMIEDLAYMWKRIQDVPVSEDPDPYAVGRLFGHMEMLATLTGPSFREVVEDVRDYGERNHLFLNDLI